MNFKNGDLLVFTDNIVKFYNDNGIESSLLGRVVQVTQVVSYGKVIYVKKYLLNENFPHAYPNTSFRLATKKEIKEQEIKNVFLNLKQHK